MIFLDQDGVLADFDGAMASRGVINRHDFIHTPKSGWTQEEKDLDHKVTAIMNQTGFWTSIPVMKRAYELVELCLKHDTVGILTARPNQADNYWVAKEKYSWIVDNFGPLPFFCCLRSEKSKFVETSRFLVDDMIQNCKDWVKKGGVALLYKDPDKDFDKVRYVLEQ